MVGEHLRYAFVYKGRWLAVATWSAATFHIKDRDQFIGWSPEQCRRRRALLANNSRLLVMPDCHSPNLISRFMKLMLGQSRCRRFLREERRPQTDLGSRTGQE